MTRAIADTLEVPSTLTEAQNIANGRKAADLPLAGSIDQILAADDVQYETVPVPEWGFSMRFASLTGLERNAIAIAGREWKKAHPDQDEMAHFQARIILASWVDEDGVHIGKQADAVPLTGKNGAALTRCYAACARLSGLGNDEQEDIADDLKETPSVVTGSD